MRYLSDISISVTMVEDMLQTQKNEDKLVKIKFDGQAHQVDAQVFISTLINFSEIVKEVNRDSGSDKKIEIKIVATEKGSFDAHLILQQAVNAVQTELAVQPVATIASVVAVVAGLYGFRKWLSTRNIGKTEPQQDDSVKITDTNGDSIVIMGNVYNIYNNNQGVNDAVSNSFATLQEDPSITGLEISDESSILFRADKDDFESLSTKIVIEDENTKKIVREAANLTINKIVFEGAGRKWDFVYQGNNISANITDADFFQQIDNGERFAKGDQLQANLEVTQVYDEALRVYLNKSYTVVKVVKHIPRDSPEQLDILTEY